MKKMITRMTTIFITQVKDKLPITTERFLEVQKLISDSALCQYIATSIKNQPGINLTTKITLATALVDLPEVKAEIKNLAFLYLSQRIPAAAPCSDPDESGTVLESAKQAIDRYINAQSQRIDTRIQDDADILVRRLDSLARLLTVSSRYSSCLALTIHEDTLWVSLNRDKEELFRGVLLLIKQRVDFIKNTIEKYKEEDYDTLLKVTVPGLVADLIKIGGSTIPAENLTQDFAKLIFANGSNCSRLSSEQKKTLTLDDKRVVLLHAGRDKENTKAMGVEVTELTDQELGQSSFHRLPLRLNKPPLYRQFHAEQLMIHYLRELGMLDPENPVRLGITKLCCYTCDKYLSDTPEVLKRGTHGLAYEGTFNLHTGEAAQANGLNPRVTHPHRSPPFSPIKTQPIGSPQQFVNGPETALRPPRSPNITNSPKKLSPNLFKIKQFFSQHPLPPPSMTEIPSSPFPASNTIHRPFFNRENKGTNIEITGVNNAPT
ncbi:hypothetical protein [Legionella antarctica]|nr:hypothetical protein [Legionella antarctica]